MAIPIFDDKEFQSLDYAQKRQIATNYFNRELADDEFRKLDSSTQNRIIGNYLKDNIGEPKRTWGEATTDTLKSAAAGVNSVVQMGGDLYGLATGNTDNVASKLGKEGADYWHNSQSDAIKQQRADQQAYIDAGDGEGDKFWRTVKSTATNPALLSDFIAEQAPQFVVGGVAGRGVGLGAKALGAGAKTAGRAATAGAIGAESAMQGAQVGGQTYEQLMQLDDGVWAQNKDFQNLVGKGMSPDEAKHDIALSISRKAGAVGGALTVGTQFLPGGQAVERVLAGATREGAEGGIKGALKGGAKAFLGEGIGEGIEEGGGQVAQNYGVQQVDPNQSLMEGVGQNAAQGALLGGLMGGTTGAIEGSRKSMKELVDEKKAQMSVPTEPNVEAATKGMETASNNLNQSYDLGFNRASEKATEPQVFPQDTTDKIKANETDLGKAPYEITPEQELAGAEKGLQYLKDNGATPEALASQQAKVDALKQKTAQNLSNEVVKNEAKQEVKQQTPMETTQPKAENEAPLFSKEPIDRQANLTEWHKDSSHETKNADGTPKVFYHGTPNNFDTFEADKIGSSTDSGVWGSGFYFGSEPNIANFYSKSKYGSNVMPTYLNMKNPFILTKETKKSVIEKIGKEVDNPFETTEEYSNRIKEGLINRGYDGVIDKIGDHNVVFNPNQIKSVHNKGTFDASNPNILESKSNRQNSGATLEQAEAQARKLLGDKYDKHKAEGLTIVQSYKDLPADLLQRANLYSITAFHGTPHNVDKFSTKYIGTGEGAQAYGYGLYFAGDKSVAEYYQNKLGKKNAENKYKDIEVVTPEAISYIEYKSPFSIGSKEWLDGLKDAPKKPKEILLIDKLKALEDKRISRISKGRDGGGAGGFNRDIENIRHQEQLVKDEIAKIQNKYIGNLYKVELKPEEYELLDWDKPLSKQSDYIKNIIINNKSDFNYPTKDMIGASIHNALRDMLGSDKLASEYLIEKGIKGVKYYDGNSRNGGKENHNYVIFHDDEVGAPELLHSGGKPRGLFDPKTGKAYIIADTMKENEVQGVILHELLHKAINDVVVKMSDKAGRRVSRMEAMLGSQYSPLIARLKELNKLGDRKVRQAYRHAKNAGTSQEHMMEEVMAYLLQHVSNEDKQMLRKFINDFIKAVRDFVNRVAVRMGTDPKWMNSKLDADGIVSLLRNYAINSEQAMGEGSPMMSKQDRLTEWHKEASDEFKKSNGNPKVFYHASPSNFDTFNISKPMYGNQAEGAYFSSSKSNAKKYGDNLYEVYINSKNPMIIDGNGKNYNDIADEINYKARWAEHDGYDSVLIKNVKDSPSGNGGVVQDTVIVFKPNQIKSIHNQGTYNEEDANILHSKSVEEVRQATKSYLNDQIKKSAVQRSQEVLTKAKDEDYGSIKSMLRNTLPQSYIDGINKMIMSKHKTFQDVGIIQAALSELTLEQRMEIHEYLGGDREDISDDLKHIANKARKLIDDMGKQAVEQGVLPAELVAAWEGKYIRRDYKKDQLQGMSKFKSIVLNNKKTLAKQFERGLSEEFKADKSGGKDAVEFINRYLEAFGHDKLKAKDLRNAIKELEARNLLAGKDEAQWKSKGKILIDEKPTKFVIARDFSKSERSNMEEITDAAFSVPNTILRLSLLLEHGKFLKDISETLDKKFMVDSFDDVKAMGEEGNFRQIENRPKYGMLAGKWVRKDIYDDITANQNQMYERGGIFDLWLKTLSTWKKSKTVWNPVGHFNNYMSNLFIKYGLGINPFKYNWKAGEMLARIKDYEALEIKEAKGTLTEDEQAEYASLNAKLKGALELRDAGMLGNSQLLDINRGFEQEGIDIKPDSSIVKGLKKLDEKVSNLYQGGDMINRLSAYLSLKDEGISKEDAMTMVSKLFPDYSQPMPKLWRLLRDTGVSPFISWTYYTLPAIFNITKANPTRALTAYAFLMSLSILGVGASSDDWDEFINAYANLPEEAIGRRIPIYSKDGEVTTWKVDRLIPGIDLASPLIGAGAGAIKGYQESQGDWLHTGLKTASGSLSATGNSIRSNFAGPSVNLAMYNTVGNDSYSGREIVKKDATDKQRIYQMTKYFVEQYAPLPTPLMRMYDIAEGQVMGKDERKRGGTVVPRTAGENLAGFAGVNLLTYDTKALEKQQKDFTPEAQEFSVTKSKITDIQGMIKDAEKRRDTDRMQKLQEKYADELKIAGDLKHTTKQLNKLKGMREEAMLNNDDEAVLQLNEQITNIMRDFNERNKK